jgi:hypothetical protein
VATAKPEGITMSLFASELDRLIREHVGKNPKCGDDLCPVIDALYAAADKWAKWADQYKWNDESELEFRWRMRNLNSAR